MQAEKTLGRSDLSLSLLSLSGNKEKLVAGVMANHAGHKERKGWPLQSSPEGCLLWEDPMPQAHCRVLAQPRFPQRVNLMPRTTTIQSNGRIAVIDGDGEANND